MCLIVVARIQAHESLIVNNEHPIISCNYKLKTKNISWKKLYKIELITFSRKFKTNFNKSKFYLNIKRINTILLLIFYDYFYD